MRKRLMKTIDSQLQFKCNYLIKKKKHSNLMENNTLIISQLL